MDEGDVMRIGMDVSIEVCRDEGYMVMDYPVHKFKKDPTTTDCRFTTSWPDYLRDGRVGEKVILLDMWLNWEDLWEMYIDSQKGIDSMIGGNHKETDSPEPFDLLNLASDLNAYCGMEYT